MDSESVGVNEVLSEEQFRARIAARKLASREQAADSHTKKKRRISSPSCAVTSPVNLGQRSQDTDSLIPPIKPHPTFQSVVRERFPHLHLLCFENDLAFPEFDYLFQDSSGFSGVAKLAIPEALVASVIDTVKGLSHLPAWQETTLKLETTKEDETILLVEQWNFDNIDAAEESLAGACQAFLRHTLDKPALRNPQPSCVSAAAILGDYVTILGEFIVATKNPNPIYEVFHNDQKWFATVRVNLTLPITDPLVLRPTSDGSHQFSELIFDSSREPFGAKKNAKQAAAREAFMFLHKNGLLEKKNGAPNRKNGKSWIPQLCFGSQDFTALKANEPGKAPKLSTYQENTPNEDSQTLEYQNSTISDGERINILRRKLDLGDLRYDIQPEEGKPSFYCGAAFLIDRKASNLWGSLGAVENVYGKKTAKKMIQENLVGILEKELDRRTLGVGPSCS